MLCPAWLVRAVGLLVLVALPASSLRGKEQIHVTRMSPAAPPTRKVLFTVANTTRGKCNSLFKSVVIYRTCVSSIKKCHMWYWIWSLLPLPKNITLSNWNFLLIWASLHSNSTVHLWCTSISCYNLWTRQNEPCPIPLSKGEVHCPRIHGTHFYILHMCGLSIVSFYTELPYLYLVNKYKYATYMKLYTCRNAVYSCPEGRLSNASITWK